MGRNTQLSIEDENERQLAIYKVNYGSKLFFKDGEIIEKGKNCRMGSLHFTSDCWNRRYSKLYGFNGRKFSYRNLRWCNRFIIEICYRLKSSSKNSELKPRITLRDEKGEIIKKADGNEARYYLVPDTILSVKDGQKFLLAMFLLDYLKKHQKQKI